MFFPRRNISMSVLHHFISLTSNDIVTIILLINIPICLHRCIALNFSELLDPNNAYHIMRWLLLLFNNLDGAFTGRLSHDHPATIADWPRDELGRWYIKCTPPKCSTAIGIIRVLGTLGGEKYV